ncbi:MAG: c-type cytochrome [Chromatiales bacterium]|nr:c-type cytochrome [Chromatiales bacterium]
MHRRLASALSLVALACALGGPSHAADPSAAIVSKPCAGCHGIDGASKGDAPIIAGLSAPYLASTMRAYKNEQRYATIMNRIAKGYDDAQLDAMAGYFSSQSWPNTKQDIDAGQATKGQALHASKGCLGCHGPQGVSMMPTAPRLAGQYAGFLEQQMKDYRDPGKPIPPAAMVMRSMLSGLNDADIAALAAFYASQNP